MKRNFTIIGLLLALLIAGNGCRNTMHDRKEMNDPTKMGRMHMGQNSRHNRGNESNSDSLMMRGMRKGMGPGWMGPRRQFMRHSSMGMGNGMRRGAGPGMMHRMGQMPMDSTGWIPMGPGRRILASVPNVTEKQKRQIEELNKENREEVMKLRQDMNAKIRNIMDSHRKEVFSILTDEQKKFIDSGRVKHFSAPEKVK